MRKKKRVTDEVVIVEDRENNKITVRRNYKGFKKLFNLLRKSEAQEFAQASSATTLMAGTCLLSVCIGLSLVNNELSAVWALVLGVVGMVVSIPAIFYSSNQENFKKEKKEYLISYKENTGKFFDAIPDSFFEEYFTVMERIDEIDENSIELHKALKKPMTDFLRKELEKRLSELRIEKDVLSRKASLLQRKSVEILESYRKIDELDEDRRNKDQIKKNDAEVLELLEQFNSSVDAVHVERDKSGSERFSSRS